MKKVVTSIVLAAIIVSLSGCVVAIGNKGGESKGHVCKSKETVSATIAEIDAIGKNLHTESARRKVYMTIAQRPYLSPAERTHLINAAMKNLHTESARQEILLKLAANPTTCHEPKPKPEPENADTQEEADAESEK